MDRAYIPCPEAHGRFPFQWATCEHCKKETCVESKGEKNLHPSPDKHRVTVLKQALGASLS